jgi:rubrerythrin
VKRLKKEIIAVATKPSFEQLEASLLFCPQCRQAMPVRKKLLLILMEGNKFEYVCTTCGSTCGDKIEADEKKPRFLM